MLMFRSTHEAAMAERDREFAQLFRSREADRATIDALDKSARRYKQERDAATVKIDRMTAPLRAANEARKLKAAVRETL